MILHLYNLHRARLLKRQAYDIRTKVQALRNDFIKFKAFKMFNLKDVDAQLASAQFLIFEN